VQRTLHLDFTADFINRASMPRREMSQPLLLLVERDDARRSLMTELFSRERFDVVAVVDAGEAAAARSSAAVSACVAAISLVDGAEGLLSFVAAWHGSAGNLRVPVLAIVSTEDERTASAALEAGADDVLRWPAGEAFLRMRLRAVDQLARLRAEVESFSSVLGSVVDAVEAREPYSIEHAPRVAALATALARLLGLSTEEVDRIGRAARIYDIGMVAIPDRIVHAPRGISRTELAEVRSHPVVGYELLRGLPSLEPLLPFVHRHHERIDGSGYPDGLVGREIPVAVQVLSIADIYDVLTSARPYRDVRPPGIALAILRSESARGVWDPALVEGLEKAIGG
jgi:putative two-component system response regulator